MNDIITYLLLGISLSMDAFSLCIVLGTIINKKVSKALILFIGLFHFIMPMMGSLLGYKIKNILNINGEYVLGIILILLSVQVFINALKKEEIDINFSIYSIILLAMSVSLDSFTLGIGLAVNMGNIIVGSIIFSLCATMFTILGVIIGKYASSIFGLYSKLIGGIILLCIGLYNIF